MSNHPNRGPNYNAYLKKIRSSHAMQREDVLRCCVLGGLEITNSRAEGWARAESDGRRFIRMGRAEFEAFLDGLPAWAAETYHDG